MCPYKSFNIKLIFFSLFCLYTSPSFQSSHKINSIVKNFLFLSEKSSNVCKKEVYFLVFRLKKSKDC